MELLLLSHEEVDEAIPSLGLLAHRVQRAEPTATAVMAAAEVDVVLVDARTELAAARTLCRARWRLRSSRSCPRAVSSR